MRTSASDRWWPTGTTQSLLLIPPFPGTSAKPGSTNIETGHLLPAEEALACITGMGQARVGGTFWAAQPDLPKGTVALLRPRDAGQFREMATLASKEGLRAAFWFPDRKAMRTSGVGKNVAIVGACDPWHLLAQVEEVWADRDDHLALFAAIAGVPHRLFADPAHLPTSGELIDPVARLSQMMDGQIFHDPFSGTRIEPSSLVTTLGFWREMIDSNRPVGAIYGVAFWKRPSVAPLLWNGSDTVPFRNTLPATDIGAAAASWIARTPARILAHLQLSKHALFQIEDGFVRSVGLGANCVPPLSIVVDPFGAHYDPAQASGLEQLLSGPDFSPRMLERAQRLRALIVERGISKYGVSTRKTAQKSGGRRRVLVTGQVEDDQSVLKGGGGLVSNLELLRRVRAIEPDAIIVYRPHPDVDAGHRKGYIEDDVVLTVADSIAREDAITSLIDAADHVHVLTSLAGFEALLRGKPVTTHGVPFYAGWGLTEDLGPVPVRRTKKRSLDELVAAALLLYPRYLDPVTGLPCPPEVLIDRIASGASKQSGPLIAMRQQLGRLLNNFRNLSIRNSAERRA